MTPIRYAFTVQDIIRWQPTCIDNAELRRRFGPHTHRTPLDAFHANLTYTELIWLLLRDEVLPTSSIHKIACDCAERVIHIFNRYQPNDTRPRQLIDVKRRWLNDDATKQDVKAARIAAMASANSANSANHQDAAYAALATVWASLLDAANVKPSLWISRNVGGKTEEVWHMQRIREELIRTGHKMI